MRNPASPSQRIVEADFFVLRTPSLPATFLDALARAGRPGSPEDLPGLVAPTWIREALFLASPLLESRIDDWAAGRLEPERAGRITQSLRRYLTRMAYRCTPFGLFAGMAKGPVGGRLPAGSVAPGPGHPVFPAGHRIP